MRDYQTGRRGELRHLEFDDILDFLDYANAVPEYYHSHDSSDRRNQFCGGSFEDAVRQASTGNPELVSRMFEGVNALSSALERESPGEIRDVTGEYFDVADFLSGEPECFRRSEFVERKPVVPVYASFSMDYRVSNEIIRNRGCAIIALCDELSRSGCIVDLHLVHVVESGAADREIFRDKIATSIRLGLDPLDLDTAAFVLANPLCLRRLWFAVLEHATGHERCAGYGRPTDYVEEPLPGIYFVSSAHERFQERNFRTLNDAGSHLLAMLEEFQNGENHLVLG